MRDLIQLIIKQVIDALDIALNAIDTEKPNDLIDIATSFDEIYEEINEFKPLKATTTAPKAKQADAEKLKKTKAIESKNVVKTVQLVKTTNETIKANKENNSNDEKQTEEPYYQVPTSAEPYYEVPSSRPIPVYENVDMYYDNTSSAQKFGIASSTKLPLPIGSKVMEPPKEKPPPPPAESNDEEESDGNVEEEPLPSDPMKRINSTKRIKKEIRSKRSSFLGIEGSVDDDSYLELKVAPPPDMMAAFIQEERRIEKQMYIKSGLYDSSDTAESRDSGVSENHSRQSSEPITSSSEEQEQEISQSRPEIISALEKDKKLLEAGKNALAMECRAFGTQQWVYSDGFPQNLDNDPILKALDEKERARCIEEQIREEEEVLRVERELLQLEQEELKRQRENQMNRKAYSHLVEHQQAPPVDHRRSLQNINVNNNLYANVYSNNTANNYHIPNDHRKSMPNLQEMTLHEIDIPDKQLPPVPPAKPLRVQEYLKYNKQIYSNGGMIVDPRTNQSMPMHLNTIHQQSNDDFLPYVVNGSGSSNNSVASSQQYSNMSRHTLHELSAAPKPKFQDAWVQQRHNNNYENTTENGWHSSNDYIDPAGEPAYIRPRPLKEPIGDAWLSMQQKRRSDPNFNYNKHWLIQEAEQRRIDQARNCRSNSSGNTNGVDWPRKGSSDNKPLPEAVIQTLTQRVQRLSDKKR